MGNLLNALFLNLAHIQIEEKVGNTFMSIKPGILCSFNAESPSNGRHMHTSYELCIVTSGSGYFIHDSTNYSIRRGDIFVSNPGVIHEITTQSKKNNESTTLQLFYFTIHLVENLLQSTLSSEEKILIDFQHCHTIICYTHLSILDYFDFLNAYRQHKTHNEYGIKQILRTCVLDCFFNLTSVEKNTIPKEALHTNIIDNAILFIGSHLTQKITIEDISIACNTSKRNLQYHFNTHLHSTIIDYINLRRMSLASGYIRMNYKISDIGIKVGIEDPSQFSRVFKKYYGISPKQYQLEHSSNGMTYGANYSSS